MKGDVYVCPRCGNTIKEGDLPYTGVWCKRTVKCRHKGGTPMLKRD